MSLNTSEKSRDSNIELLRIILIIGVVILHYNGAVGGFDSVKSGSANEMLLHVLEAVFICAVNTFMIISGYFLCKRDKIEVFKPVDLIVQTVFWNEVFYSISIFMSYADGAQNGIKELLKGALRSLIPTNYFVVFYVVVYLLAPYINLMLNNLSKAKFRALLITLFAIFSIWTSISNSMINVLGDMWYGFNPVGLYGGQAGYTIVNFIFMYILGAYFRLTEPEFKTGHIAAVTAACIIMIFMCDYMELRFGLPTTSFGRDYCSPLVIVYSALVFLLFRNIKVGYNRFINGFAKCCFTVFLIHTWCLIKANVPHYVQGSLSVMLIHMTVTIAATLIISYIAYIVYKMTVGKLVRHLVHS